MYIIIGSGIIIIILYYLIKAYKESQEKTRLDEVKEQCDDLNEHVNILKYKKRMVDVVKDANKVEKEINNELNDILEDSKNDTQKIDIDIK